MSALNDVIQHVIRRAEAQGASGADALAVEMTEGSVRVRLGEVEEIQRSREKRVGLRVFMGQRQAISACSDLREASLNRMVDDTVSMARVTAEDPDGGLPNAADYAASHVTLDDLNDDTAETFELDAGADWARRAEKAAMCDERIDNSEGATFGFSSVERAFGASGGASGSYRTSGFTGYVVPVARDENGMERDYHWSQRRHFKHLESPEAIGRIAAERTLRRLGATQAKTCKVPVVFDDRMASRLIGYLGGALSGYAIYRGASYMKGRLGEAVFAPHITIVDDATLKGGMGSKPYDGEGLATSKKAVVENGVLTTYLLDTYSARKLSLKSTGNAARSVGDAPTVGSTNLHLLPGDCTEAELLDGISDGLYVTELIGFGVNMTTGDYSQGAAGLWIKDGKLSHAVNEITIAGNLLDIFKDIEQVADTLDVHRAVSAPALRVRELMVAGA